MDCHTMNMHLFKLLAGVTLVCLATSCRSISAQPVAVQHSTFDCTSQIPVDETNELLDQLILLQTQLYSVLEITQQEITARPRIHIYTDRLKYLQVAADHQIPGEYTDGFCDTKELELFILLKPSLFGYKNVKTLYHEFTHLALNHKLIYPQSNQPKIRLPFWFSEGIATYAETVEFKNSKAVFGKVNRKRLFLLKRFVNRDLILVDKVIGRGYDRGFSLNHYAVGWGLTYYLLSDEELSKKVAGYINNFPTSATEDSFADFKTNFQASDENYAQWEQGFVDYINHL